MYLQSVKKIKSTRHSFKRKMTPWFILFLPIVFTLWLKYYPIFSAFYISLFQYDPVHPPGKFVGFANYAEMFKMEHYWGLGAIPLFYWVSNW